MELISKTQARSAPLLFLHEFPLPFLTISLLYTLSIKIYAACCGSFPLAEETTPIDSRNKTVRRRSIVGAIYKRSIGSKSQEQIEFAELGASEFDSYNAMFTPLGNGGSREQLREEREDGSSEI